MNRLFAVVFVGLCAGGVILVSHYMGSASEVAVAPDSTEALISSDTPAPGSALQAVPVYTYKIINTYPHDCNAFTQGLVFENGFLYEGTGLHKRSTLRKVELETGTILQIYELPPQFFGEGITIFQDKIIQLTWQSNVGFVYHKDTFELLHQFTYPTEGWGITHDGTQLIMSDGTSTLYFLDPETFERIYQITVHDNGDPVTMLNELEYIQGEIYANVWLTDRIARISPQTGQVLGWIDLEGLLSLKSGEHVDVLNGIAYDAEHDRLFVTGKLWPHLFEIELVCQENCGSACPDFGLEMRLVMYL